MRSASGVYCGRSVSDRFTGTKISFNCLIFVHARCYRCVYNELKIFESRKFSRNLLLLSLSDQNIYANERERKRWQRENETCTADVCKDRKARAIFAYFFGKLNTKHTYKKRTLNTATPKKNHNTQQKHAYCLSAILRIVCVLLAIPIAIFFIPSMCYELIYSHLFGVFISLHLIFSLSLSPSHLTISILNTSISIEIVIKMRMLRI